ncbi:hypothetical protein J2X19_001768 [Rhodoferax ferrireducens]|uniref:Peptidase S74 domain-containing protein n=1 Tax=Rhodoferax ferrireducens TaxID=192843 RepID=A0ABU2C6Z3_9BURK|nr:tail fiber domain-containing protein [Rhodoferax ferrireducens]MDR7377110.1 hypothetical protein [Rhodoferax ferrireducens]
MTKNFPISAVSFAAAALLFAGPALAQIAGALVIDQTGNVGINTATPQTVLQIQGGGAGALAGSNNGIFLDEDSGGHPRIELRANSTALGPYIDFTTDLSKDYQGRIMLQNGVMTFYGAPLANPAMPTGKWKDWEYAMVSTDGSFTIAQAAHSSLRYKKDVKPLVDNYRALLSLQIKSFTYKDSGDQAYGFIAEEVHDAGLTNLVNYDKGGRPDSILHRGLPFYLLEAMKLLNQDIETLQKEGKALRDTVAKQQQMIDGLVKAASH